MLAIPEATLAAKPKQVGVPQVPQLVLGRRR